jgi:hypothetical protein
MNRVNKILALTGLSAVAGIGAVAGLAGSASAGEGNTGYIKQYAISYTSPSNATVPVHKGLPPETPVDTLCVRKGQELSGNPYWFLIDHDGYLGYVHRDDIAPPADVPSC